MTTRHGILRSLKENVKLIQLFDGTQGGGGVWWGWTACVGDNGEDWRGVMAGKEQGLCVKWPIRSVMQLGNR